MGEREDNNPIQEYPEQGLRDMIKEWYVARGTVAAKSLEQRGIDTRAEKEFADLSSRQQKLEDVEKADMSKLEQLQAKIEAFASAVGVQFDPKTGEVYFGAKRDPNAPAPQPEELATTGDELSRVSREHSEVTQNLYGEDMSNPNFDPEKSKNPGIVAAVTNKKQALMKRDASVKKLLDEKVRLEAAKDSMDMHGARHVAEKYRMMMLLEQLKLQLVREIASGAKEDDLTVQNLKYQINGVTKQMAAMESQFNQEHMAYTKDFNAARKALADASKIVEYDNKTFENVKVTNNSLSYSKDGILNGSSATVRHNDRDVEEKEIFDERGVMIFDVADVLEREKSIQIGGVVVTCVTEFGAGANVEDSFYIGDMEQLEVNTSESRAVVEEKPDIEEEIDNTNVGNATTISLFQRALTDTFYSVAGKVLRDQVQAQMLDAALKGPFHDALSTFGRGTDVQRAVIDLALEVAKEIAKTNEIEDPNDPNYKRENIT